MSGDASKALFPPLGLQVVACLASGPKVTFLGNRYAMADLEPAPVWQALLPKWQQLSLVVPSWLLVSYKLIAGCCR